MRSRPPSRVDRTKLDTFASRIVYEDERLLVIDKPDGLLSQGDRTGAPSVVELVRAYLGREGLGVLHRLDRNVSGLVMVPKTPEFAARLSRALAAHEIERVYLAVVFGSGPNAPVAIDLPLAKDERTNVVDVATPGAANARNAQTLVHTVHQFRCGLGACAELEVRPITGRSHQIRVHLAAHDWPILGDPKYGRRVPGLHRPLLHAAQLVLPRSLGGQAFTAPVPWRTADLARTLGYPARHRRA